MYISIGIPFYNAQEYLALAIESVINQSFEDWELILVNDGSSDGSLEIAKRFEVRDSRIRVISDGKNKKLPYRLNQIINESKYDYIARMDADDMAHPDRLKIQMQFLQDNPDYDLVSTGVVSINNHNKVYGYRNIESVYNDFSEVKKSYPIVHASILARKAWYQRNKYNTNHPRSQDYELWCRAASKEDLKLAVLPDLLYYYREEGILDSKKLINSYNNGFRVYTKYHGSFDIKRFIKISLKKLAVKGLDYSGLLQKIASKRNQKTASTEIINKHQQVVNNIVNLIR